MAKARNKVYNAADTVKPYVERAMADEKLRADLMHAFQTARQVYSDLSRRDTTPLTVATRVATDEDIREKLRDAIDDLRRANERLQGRESHSVRNGSLLVAGIALGILFNPVTGPETRRFLRDLMFGGSEVPPGSESYDGRE
jgi:hypothetical protein